MAFEYPVAPEPPRGEDLPESGGPNMESERHLWQGRVLIESLVDAWRDRDDFYCGGDMLVYFSATQARRNDFLGPDVFVVRDVPRHERRRWVAWEEGGRLPDVVIEVTSPTTEENDRGDKMRTYARVWHVAEYFVFDPFAGTLDGFDLDARAGEYRRKAPRADGDLDVPTLGLRLGTRRSRIGGIECDWLRWIDAEGRPLPVGRELADDAIRRADEEKQRADEERKRADEQKQRADELAARVAELEARARR